LPVLEEIVGDRDHREHRHHGAHQLQRQGGGHAHDRRRVEPQHRLQPMTLGPQDRHHNHAERDHLEKALGEIRHRLLAEDPLGPRPRRDLAEFRLQRLGRPHQPVLHHVARDRRQRQHQEVERPAQQLGDDEHQSDDCPGERGIQGRLIWHAAGP